MTSQIPTDFRTPLTTSCAHPWALVRYASGTQLGFLTAWVATAGHVHGFRAVTFTATGRQMQAKPRYFPIAAVLATWRHKPTPTQLRWAKRGLRRPRSLA